MEHGIFPVSELSLGLEMELAGELLKHASLFQGKKKVVEQSNHLKKPTVI